MTQTGDRVTRYLYDKDHRRVGIVDALGFFTEYRYDAGGRLAETVRHRDRAPAPVNMTAPLWAGVTHQTVIAGRAFDYPVPASVADGDEPTLPLPRQPPACLSVHAPPAPLPPTPPRTATPATGPLI